MNAAAPIRYARKHLVFDHAGRSAGLYRLPTTSYSLLPDQDKWTWLLGVAGLALRARADITIWRVNRKCSSTGYVPQAADLVDPRFQDPDVWCRFLESHGPHLDRLDSHEPEVYLRVAHEKPNDNGNLLRTVDRATRHVNEMFGVGQDAPITQREITKLEGQADRALDRLRGAMPAVRPVTSRELQWLCQRAATQGIGEPQLDPNWHPDAMVVHSDKDGVGFRPCAGDIRRLYGCVITRESDSDGHYVLVSSEQGTSYQAFLTLGMLPAELDFPGSQAELMFAPLDALPFAVDAVAIMEWVTNKRALAEVRRKIRNADEAIRDAFEAMRTPDNRSLMTPSLARDLQQILSHESRPPMFDATVSYRVSAATREELKHRVESLREQFTNVSLHMPPGEQERLFYAHLPTPTTVITDWAQRLTLDQVGMLMPVAARGVGDSHGVYWAHTIVGNRSRTPVKIDVGGDARRSKPSTIYMAGKPGSGKTIAALYAGYIAAMRGSQVFTVDPGGDHFLTGLPGLVEAETAVIELKAREQDRGSLDPLVVAPPELQEEVALSYYLDLLPDTDAAGQRKLMAAIKQARLDGTGSLGAIDVLRRGDAIAAELAEGLSLIGDFGNGVLGFSDGRRVHDSNAIARVATFRMKSLGLPKATTPPAAYDRRQRVAVATFKVAVAHIVGLVTKDPGVEKVIILDEAWVFDSPSGQQLLDELVRLARKNNARIILISQTVADLGDLKHLIGMYVVFGVASDEQAADTLELIGLDRDDASLRGMLTADWFEKGMCIIRDSHGRVDLAQIDTVHDEILDGLDTRPEARARKLAIAA